MDKICIFEASYLDMKHNIHTVSRVLLYNYTECLKKVGTCFIILSTIKTCVISGQYKLQNRSK